MLGPGAEPPASVAADLVMSGTTQWEPNEWTAPVPTLFGAIARYRWAIVAAVGACLVLGFVLSNARTPTYEATATIYLSDVTPFGGEAADPTRRMEQEAARVESRSVLDGVVSSLGGDLTRDELAEQLSFNSETEAGIVQVTAAASDPERAAEMANTVVDVYRRQGRRAVQTQVEAATTALTEQADALAERADELETEVDTNPSNATAGRQLQAVEAQVLELEARMSDLVADAALFGAGVSDVEAAVPPAERSSPKPIRDAALAAVLGFALASGVAYWRAGSDRRLDPSAVFGAPLLAQIPEFRQWRSGNEDPLFDLEAVEAYQFLLSSFEFAVAQTGARSVLVTSASPGDGKSLTSLHLARALAVQGNDVMLVDADIRDRGLSRLLRAEGQPGLVTLAEGEELGTVTRQYRITNALTLSVIPAGPRPVQPTGLLATPSYRRAINAIVMSNDLTIIDGSPLLTVADASAVATQVDGIVLVLDVNTSEDDILRIQKRLRMLATPLLGYLVNRVPPAHSKPHLYGQPMPAGRLRRLFNGGRDREADQTAWHDDPQAASAEAPPEHTVSSGS